MKGLDWLKDKNLLILGFAREGVDTFHFLRRLFPGKVLAVADQSSLKQLSDDTREIIRKDSRIKSFFGPDCLNRVGDYEVIIKSPGIPPKVLKPYLKKGQIITSQTEIFLENCPGKIIGVTGTKGKSTTTSLIYEVLKEGGLKAHLVGNIGKPVLSLLLKAKKEDIFVYELSSHQLMSLKKSPSVAVFLNIYPEHLDYYGSFDKYLKAKQNICRHQKSSDFFLFNPEGKDVKKTALLTRAKKISLDSKKAERFLGKSRLHQGFGGQGGRVRLLGRFNLLNIATAIEIGRLFGVEESLIAKAIRAFKPLPHRLEPAGEYRGIKFYNDSLATIPEATVAAFDALGEDVQTIFLGGFDRGLDFKNLARKILSSQVETLIFFPTTGKKIWQAILNEKWSKERFFNHFFVDTMKEGVKLAFEHTSKGKICLLSCASPSFGLFKDYRERGDLFKKFIRRHGRT